MPSLTNEHLRLFASYLNIVAAGAMVASLITEPFTWALSTAPRPWTEALFALISLGLSMAFHLAAQMTLRRVEEDEP